MNNFNFARAHDQYLNPPDEPEAVYCESCGEEMEVKQDWKGNPYAKCKNEFCPGKFITGVEREMANELVEAREEVKTLKAKVKRLEMKWIS